MLRRLRLPSVIVGLGVTVGLGAEVRVGVGAKVGARVRAAVVVGVALSSVRAFHSSELGVVVGVESFGVWMGLRVESRDGTGGRGVG